MNAHHLLKLIFALKGNLAAGITAPHIEVDGVGVAAFLEDRPAAVSISADFELNWAWRELPPDQRDVKGRSERENLPYLLSEFDRTRVPVTWATVGHMFLHSCARGADGRAHPEMPRPPKNDRWTGDWYVHDPCGNVETDPLWYSPDLVQQLLASDVRHEIGSHSFSHIDFSGLCSTPELVESEIRACVAAMAPFGLELRSLVYPFNKMGHEHLDLLAGLGVVAVRHRDPRIRLSYPERTPSGVYKIYETLNLRKARHYDYPDKARIFIDEAVRRRAAFHIWFHPSASPEVLRDVFTPILEQIAQGRDAGNLWTATMSELVAYCAARDTVELRVARTNHGLTVTIDPMRFDVRRYGPTKLTLVIQCAKTARNAFLSENGSTRQIDVREASVPGSVLVTIPIGTRKLDLVL